MRDQGTTKSQLAAGSSEPHAPKVVVRDLTHHLRNVYFRLPQPARAARAGLSPVRDNRLTRRRPGPFDNRIVILILRRSIGQRASVSSGAGGAGSGACWWRGHIPARPVSATRLGTSIDRTTTVSRMTPTAMKIAS